MIIIYISGFILALLFIILIIAGRETVPSKIDTSKVTAPFYKAGVFFYRRLFEDRERQSAYFQKIYDAKSVLNPAGRTGEEVAVFFIEKAGLCLLIIFMGNLIAIGSSLTNMQSSYLEEGNQIKRGDYNQRDYEIVLNATIEEEGTKNETSIEVSVPVISRKYSREQLNNMMESFCNELVNIILENNESADFVNSHVNFVEQLEGYPFYVEYKWNGKEIIDRNGNIQKNIDINGTLVNVEALIKYDDFQYQYNFALNVFPEEMSRQQVYEEAIYQETRKIQENTETEEYYILPDSINGMEIHWTEKKTNNTWIFILLVVCGTIAVFIGKDKDLYSKLEERSKQMNEDYPEIVSKITLLAGAGMTIRGAWKKIAMEYKEKKDRGMKTRYAYEEMLYTLYEMESGVEETICYSHFSMRARVQKYVKLVSLLDQNLKMGSKGLITNLKNESREAFEERKNQAEKKGEEAGTKLLLPMGLMLVVVMVIIMFPAFMSM